MRVGFISDLHLTHNGETIDNATDILYKESIIRNIEKLFIVGDTSDNYKDSIEIAERITSLGIDTYTLFGNHEYFSITYEEALQNDNHRYFANKITRLTSNTAIVSIDGFFDYTFVKEVDNVYTSKIPKDKSVINRMNKDSSAIRESNIGNFSEVFKSMENTLIRLLEEASLKYEHIFIVLHYAPSEIFIEFKENDIVWNSRNSFMGSVRYKEIAEEYNVDKVIFGHTHNRIDVEVNGVNYYCNSVGYGGVEFDEPFKERVVNTLRVFEL